MRPTLYAFATAQLDGLLAQNELDLAGLLEPFQVTNVRVTDTAHQSHLITALPLHIVEARTQPRPESTEHFIDSLDSLVHRAAAGDIPPPLQVAAPTRAADAGNEGWKGRPVESITPWFAVMRDHVLHKRDLVEYETFACPVACLLAISTADPDPLSTLADLWDRTSKDNLFPPASTIADEDYKSEWINPEVLRYILLVHDSSAGGGRDALEEAQRLHEKVIKTYGSHTTLLPLFSASPTSINPLARSSKVPSLWRLPRPSPGSEPTQMQKGENLSDQDLQGIDKFMREMVVQSIVPFMERTILISNEQFIASKRSIGGRLFSAGRKYFGASASSSASGSRTGSPSQGTTGVMNGGFNVTRGYYPFTTQEAQTRRLADFAFMLEDFRLAVTVYDSLCKDFKIDRAWRYYAAACRMVGLSQLRLHPTGTPLTFNPDLSLESAMDIGGGASIERSLQGAAGVDFDGLRAVLLYYDAYRAIGDWRAAERGLVRQAGEMEEITSAVLLEQAAIANLNLPRCSRRKFAFWMILAGERYEKCGLKILSRRCLSQAASVYAFSPSDDASDVDPGWDQIQSRLFIKLARQAYNSGKYVEAVNWFLQEPFRAPEAVTDVQDEMRGEREAWLEDFALAWDHLSPESTKTFCDENPNKWEGIFFDPNRVSIRVGLAEESDALDRAGYADLLTAFGNAVAGRGVQVKRTGNEVVIGQTFYLELYASNPLDEQITFGGLQVLTDASETERGKIEVGLPTDIVLEAREVRRVMLAIVSRSLVPFTFTSLSFTFAKLLPLSSTLRKAPRRLTSTRAQLIEPTYSLPADDTSLLVRMVEPIPVLSVSFTGVRERVYEGETVRGWLELGNLGGAVMQGLKGLCSEPWVLELVQSAEEIYTPGEGGKEHVVVDNRIRGNEPFVVPLLASGLAPSGLVKVPVVLRGMHRGDHLLRFMFQFVGPDVNKTLSWRGSFRVCVEPSIRIEPSLRASNSFTNPYLLGLEISNSFQGTEVSIDQISSLSPRWEIAALENSSSTPARLDISTLLPRQSESFFCTVRPSSSFDPAPSLASTAFVARKVEALLSGKDFKGSFLGSIGLEASSISSPKQGIQLGAEVLRDSIVKSLRQGRREELDRQLSSLEKGFHEHLFPLISTTELILVIFYSFLSPNSALRRQGHLLLSLPISARTNILKEVIEKAELKAGGIYAQSQRERITLLDSLRRSEWGAEECPALIGVRVSEILEWNFEQEPCALPLVFTLRNISTTLSFSYILRLTTPSTASSSSTTLFAGPLSFTGQCLPLGTTTVNSSLWIPREGSFDIGQRWHVEINALDCAGLVVGSWTKQGERSLVRARQSDAGRIEDRSLLDEPVAAA